LADHRKAASFLGYGLIVMTVTHVLTHVFGGIHTAIFSILRAEFTLTLQQLGVIAAIPPLCQALLAVPTGLLSDRVGAKRMVILSFVVAVVGAVLASQATTPLVFIVAVSLVYVNTTIYHPASYSYTTKLYPGRDRPKAMGLHGAGGTLGHALGPLSVSVLIGVLAFAWRQVYFVLAIPMLLGIALVLFIRDETAADFPAAPPVARDCQPPGAATLLTASLVAFLVFSGLRMMASSMISTFLVLYLQDVRQLSLGLASLVSSGRMLLGFLAAPLGGIMAARYGEKRWLLGVLALSYLLLGLSLASPGVTGFVFLYVASGFCNTLVMAARSSIMAKLSPRRRRGLGYALYFLPGSVMGAVAPVLAGYLGASFGFDAIFYVSLGISVLALALLKLGVHVA
jgi:MFS family permease